MSILLGLEIPSTQGGRGAERCPETALMVAAGAGRPVEREEGRELGGGTGRSHPSSELPSVNSCDGGEVLIGT